MNSLNLLSASVLGQNRSESRRPRSNSEGSKRKEPAPSPPKRAASQYHLPVKTGENGSTHWLTQSAGAAEVERKEEEEDTNEKTPLLGNTSTSSFAIESKAPRSKVTILVQRLSGALVETVRWVVTKALAPGAYILALFYTDEGLFSPLAPVRRLLRHGAGKSRAKNASSARRTSGKPGTNGAEQTSEKRQLRSSTRSRQSSPVFSDSEADSQSTASTEKGTGAVSSSDESTTSKRSIRIKQNDEPARRRRAKKKPDSPEEAIAKELKSPTSPNLTLKLDKYPHAPAPPRPLIPRRQPSYSSKPSQPNTMPKKTLVLDLDETLIHSMAKGGRMSTGHMVEVKLAAPTAYHGVSLGPQHPILYYVHKRPHCDEFLRKVSQWYNLVIFTASVQEYADPVIDWLELERKYFTGRYYRQHCTFRTGAYIKDLGSIEPDLSKVIILDNSPLSYIFHEGEIHRRRSKSVRLLTRTDNAVPIEGWINDPTDNDLLHLVPLFEGLQYVTDVRALLGLRRGQVDQGGK